MINTINKLFLALVLICSFSLYCSKEKGGAGMSICASNGSWHDKKCDHRGAQAGASGNGGCSKEAHEGASSGMQAYKAMVSAQACGAGTKTDADIVRVALLGLFGSHAKSAAIAAGGAACPVNAALAVRTVYPNIHLTADGKIIGHDIFISKDGTQCTRADLARSLTALVNLEEIGNPVIQQTIAKIKTEYFANDPKLFACAAENIVAECLFPNASHVCYKSYPPAQVLSSKDLDAHNFVLGLMRKGGCV